MEQVQGTLLAGLGGTSKSSTKIYFTMQNIIITTVSFSSEFESCWLVFMLWMGYLLQVTPAKNNWLNV